MLKNTFPLSDMQTSLTTGLVAKSCQSRVTCVIVVMSGCVTCVVVVLSESCCLCHCSHVWLCWISPCRLTLDEVAAAAEMILAQEDEAAAKDEEEEEMGNESSDEGLGGEVDTDCECDEDGEEHLLGDSGYGGQSMEELGADALLCLAGGSSRSNSPPPTPTS